MPILRSNAKKLEREHMRPKRIGADQAFDINVVNELNRFTEDRHPQTDGNRWM